MAEEEEAPPNEDTDNSPPSGKSGPRWWIIASVLAVLQIVLTIVAVILLMPKEPEMTEEQAIAAEVQEDQSLVEEGADISHFDEISDDEYILGALLPLEPFIVNLKGRGYIKLTIHIEFQRRDIPKAVYPRVIYIRDGIINLLATKTKDRVLSRKGRTRLKGEILALVNELLKEEVARQILFSKYIVQ